MAGVQTSAGQMTPGVALQDAAPSSDLAQAAALRYCAPSL
jgi:hypothetical protein